MKGGMEKEWREYKGRDGGRKGGKIRGEMEGE